VVLCSSLLWLCTGRCVLLGEVAVRAESLFAPVLTSHTGEDETSTETGHNAGTNTSLQ
jgi:hypothetical protein